MKRLLEKVRGFMALLSFLTMLPMGVHDLKLASQLFYLAPLVGLIEGLIAVAPILLDAPIHVKAALILSASYLITGFIHLDGFADFADALGSGRSGRDALRVMKEPGRGAFGIAATALLMIIAYSSLVELAARGWWHMIILSHILASESVYLLARLSRPPSYQGLSRSFIIESKHEARLAMNILSLGAILLVVTYIRWSLVYYQLGAIALAVVTTAYTRVKSHRVLGFVNGDVLGFCYELTKTCILLYSAALTTTWV